MRKRSRSRVRTRGHVVLNAYTRMVAYFAYAQLSNKWREWTFRTISQRQAETLAAAGEAFPITRMVNGAVQIVGYRALKPTSWERPSPATLTFGTMLAVAGIQPSRRQVNKYIAWPLIGDTKAVCVRPRISEADRARAERLLGIRGGRRIESGMLGAA